MRSAFVLWIFLVARLCAGMELLTEDRMILYRNNMKLAVLSHYLKNDGAPTLLYRAIKGMCMRGWRHIDIYYLWNHRYEDLWGHFYRLPCVGRVLCLTRADDWSNIPDAMATYLTNYYDFWICNTLLAKYLLLNRNFLAPHIMLVHESDARSVLYGVDLDPDNLSWLYRNPYSTVFATNATLVAYEEFRPYMTRTDVVYCGLDPDTYTPARLSDTGGWRTVVVIGTILERKNQLGAIRTLERSAALLKRANMKINLKLIGFGTRAEGKYEDQVQSAAKKVNSEVGHVFRVELLPWASAHAAMDMIAAADVLLCNSYIEAMPLTIIEAMRLGTPVLSTDVFGISEAIVNRTNGLLYKPDEDFVPHMLQIFTNKALRAYFIANSKKAVEEKFATDVQLAAYERLVMEGLLHRRHPPPLQVREHFMVLSAYNRLEDVFLPEWIEHHYIEGFDRIVIYQDSYFASLEGLSVARKVVEPYVRRGIVEVVAWPGGFDDGAPHADTLLSDPAFTAALKACRNAPLSAWSATYYPCELSAAMDAVQRFKGRAEWIGHLDVSDFIFSEPGSWLSEVLLNEYKAHDAIEVKAKVFGPSGHAVPSPATRPAPFPLATAAFTEGARGTLTVGGSLYAGRSTFKGLGRLDRVSGISDVGFLFVQGFKSERLKKFGTDALIQIHRYAYKSPLEYELRRLLRDEGPAYKQGYEELRLSDNLATALDLKERSVHLANKIASRYFHGARSFSAATDAYISRILRALEVGGKQQQRYEGGGRQ